MEDHKGLAIANCRLVGDSPGEVSLRTLNVSLQRSNFFWLALQRILIRREILKSEMGNRQSPM